MAAPKKRKRKSIKGKPRLRFKSKRICDKYFEWTSKIRKRDRCCQWPGCKRRTRLECHHILEYAKFPHLRYDEKNGILLCAKCHKSIKGKEPCFIKLFRVIVDKKYI